MIAFFVAFVAVGTWSGSPQWGLAAGVLAAFIAVQLRPWTGCWWCGERPKRRDESGRNWRWCWMCGGKGRRRRLFAIRRKDQI